MNLIELNSNQLASFFIALARDMKKSLFKITEIACNLHHFLSGLKLVHYSPLLHGWLALHRLECDLIGVGLALWM